MWSPTKQRGGRLRHSRNSALADLGATGFGDEDPRDWIVAHVDGGALRAAVEGHG
ncbi:MAG: hypothetical protein R2854_31045 [Caldilineaceae bacterium]